MHNETLKLSMLQFDSTTGDIFINVQKILKYWQEAENQKSDILLTTESALSGYPTGDLILKSTFLKSILKAIDILISKSKEFKCKLIIGSPYLSPEDINKYTKPFNCALVISSGRIEHINYKSTLPNDDVFDEKRHYTQAKLQDNTIYKLKGYNLGILICEDAWFPTSSKHLKEHQAELLLSLNASPWFQDKVNIRTKIIQQRCLENDIPLVYVNRTGAQDGIAFDGNSFICNRHGKIIFKAASWQEQLIHVEFTKKNQHVEMLNTITEPYTKNNTKIFTNTYQAMLTTLRGYYNQNGFHGKIILGLSGGIDSALTATIASDAFGSDKVKALILPSRYTREQSIIDAQDCASSLGIDYEILYIEPLVESYQHLFSQSKVGRLKNVAQENIQSRIRGVILMAHSNQDNSMLLTTGNKSEIAVGYATIYGDMCGSFNPIGDIYKSDVFELCKWRNKNIPLSSLNPKLAVINSSIIEKEPSAELKEEQKDSDTLPPYEILDKILFALIEKDSSIDYCVQNLNVSEELVTKIEQLILNSEYKRYQAAPCTKISAKTFGYDRRYVLTNKFNHSQLIKLQSYHKTTAPK